VTPFVLLTGGKGGVGKTAAAANLGVHLAHEGVRVLLVDLDLGLANLNVMLRLAPSRTIEDALAGDCSLAECVVTGPEGVHVLPAGSGNAAMGRPDDARRERLWSGLRELADDYDVVIGDSAAGIGPDVLSAASRADLVLVVTTPDPTALTDAYGLVKALDTFALENDVEVPTPEVFVNLVSGVEQAEVTATRLRTVCEQFLARSPRMAGWLPRTAAVRRACLEQRALSAGRGRNSLEHHCLRRLSRRIERLFPALCD
jgi:flagellar biosynthesis protein FlhG